MQILCERGKEVTVAASVDCIFQFRIKLLGDLRFLTVAHFIF